MAEDEDGASDKNSPQNANSTALLPENGQNTAKPDLGIEEAKYNSNGDGESSSGEAKCSTSKSTGATRKEENPFSFRHFLKRDLSLPGNSTYEHTGARPKVYANTVQHSPTKLDVHAIPRRDKARATDTQTKDRFIDGSGHLVSDNTSSSSVEIPFSVVDNSESKHNLYINSSEAPFYHRPNLASEPLGMPSLPDFVQDHILVEQAYLNSNGPISVDLDNLPDFTFNTSGFNVGSSTSRRNNSVYSGSRDYDYDGFGGAPSTSSDYGSSSREVPLDLPPVAEAAGPSPLDLPVHLSLDLTESVNPADRRNMSPRNNFPLDLPPNAGAESMRLPDFLPVHPAGRTSPEPEHQDEQLQQIISELERTRSELFAERSRRSRLEGELESALEDNRLLRSSARQARQTEAELRARLTQATTADREYTGHLQAAAGRVEFNLMDSAARASEAESTVSQMKKQIKKLKEELAISRDECNSLRSVQSGAATSLRRATAVAETSLRDLLSGLEQLKTLSSALEPT